MSFIDTSNIFVQTIIINICVWVSIGIIAVWQWYKGRKPICHIVRQFSKENNSLFQIISSFKVNSTQKSFSIGEREYLIDWKFTAYFNKRGKPVLFYEENNPHPMRVNPKQLGDFGSKDLASKIYMFCKKKAIEQLVNASKPVMIQWSLTIAFVALTFGMAFLLGYMLYPKINPISVT